MILREFYLVCYWIIGFFGLVNKLIVSCEGGVFMCLLILSKMFLKWMYMNFYWDCVNLFWFICDFGIFRFCFYVC